MAQTNILITYIELKPLWQDTHEVSQGLEHVTFGELDTYVYVSWHIHVCVHKTLPCFPTKPCIQLDNQIDDKARLIMRNKPMKFGSNPTTFEKCDTHTRMCQSWSSKFSKYFKISHTHSLDFREHAPKVSAPKDLIWWSVWGLDTNVYGMWHAYVSWHICVCVKFDTFVYGWVYTLKWIANHIHLCTIVRGMCPCVLVKKCVMDWEIWSKNSKPHIRSQRHVWQHNHSFTCIKMK